MTTNADVIVTKLVKLVTDAAGSSLSAATTAKLTAVGAIIGEIADVIVPSLESSNKNLSGILDAVSALEDDADKFETDVKALLSAIKGTSSTVAQAA